MFFPSRQNVRLRKFSFFEFLCGCHVNHRFFPCNSRLLRKKWNEMKMAFFVTLWLPNEKLSLWNFFHVYIKTKLVGVGYSVQIHQAERLQLFSLFHYFKQNIQNALGSTKYSDLLHNQLIVSWFIFPQNPFITFWNTLEVYKQMQEKWKLPQDNMNFYNSILFNYI